MFSQDGTVPERLSEYFGALHVDHLDENDIPDPKLTQLFDECFGKKILKKPLSPIKVIANPMPSPTSGVN